MDWTDLRAGGRMAILRHVAAGPVVVTYRGRPIAHVQRYTAGDGAALTVSTVALRGRSDEIIAALSEGSTVVVASNGRPVLTLTGLRATCPTCGR